MNELTIDKGNRIESMWQIAHKIIEKEGEIHAPIVILAFHDDENFALLNGGNFDNKEEFREAIHSAASTVEASSAIMIASAKVSAKSDARLKNAVEPDGKRKLRYNEIVLLTYKSKGKNIQQVATIRTEANGDKHIGDVQNFGGLVNNTFFDGLFDTIH